MDLDTLDTRSRANAGIDVILKHPETGEPLDIVITVLGRDSDAYADKVLEQERALMQRVSKKGRSVMPSPEQIRDDANALLAAVTVGWSGVVMGGEAIAFSPAAAENLYRQRHLSWIREQVDEAVHNRALFLPRSVSS